MGTGSVDFVTVQAPFPDSSPVSPGALGFPTMPVEGLCPVNSPTATWMTVTGMLSTRRAQSPNKEDYRERPMAARNRSNP